MLRHIGLSSIFIIKKIEIIFLIEKGLFRTVRLIYKDDGLHRCVPYFIVSVSARLASPITNYIFFFSNYGEYPLFVLHLRDPEIRTKSRMKQVRDLLRFETLHCLKNI